MPVEQIERLDVVSADDRPLVARGRFAQIGIDVAGHAVIVLVATEAMLALEMLAESREAFVQPRVRPVAASDVVAEPLMSQLVSDQIARADVERRPLVEDDVLVQCGGGRIFHTAEDEIADHDLRIARPWKFHAKTLGKELQHAWRLTQAARRALSLADRHQVIYRHLVRTERRRTVL